MQQIKKRAPGGVPGAETKRAAGALAVSGAIIQRMPTVVKGIEPASDDVRICFDRAEICKAAGDYTSFEAYRREGLLLQARLYDVE